MMNLKHAICTRMLEEAGAALVEAALTGTVMVTMLIGTVEIGRVAYIAMETTNAAKAAVAYGSQNSDHRDRSGWDAGSCTARSDRLGFAKRIADGVGDACLLLFITGYDRDALQLR